MSQWRVDFGDGLFKTGFGQPPASLAHSYTKAGDFKPRLTVLSAQGATPQSATTSVSAQAAPLVGMTPTPTSGDPPLAVTFKLSTTVQNVATWAIDFGDGEKAGGAGAPPPVVHHTYKKAGTYKPQFAVKPGQNALVYTVAQLTVGGGTAPILTIAASTTSGQAPADGQVRPRDEHPGPDRLVGGHLRRRLARYRPGRPAGVGHPHVREGREVRGVPRGRAAAEVRRRAVHGAARRARDQRRLTG